MPQIQVNLEDTSKLTQDCSQIVLKEPKKVGRPSNKSREEKEK